MSFLNLEYILYIIFEGIRLSFILPPNMDYISDIYIHYLDNINDINSSLIFFLVFIISICGGVLGNLLNIYMGKLLRSIPREEMILSNDKQRLLINLVVLSGLPIVGGYISILSGFLLSKFKLSEILYRMLLGKLLYYVVIFLVFFQF